MTIVPVTYPHRIEIKAYETGFTADLDKKVTFYQDIQILSNTILSQVRREMLPVEVFAGSC